jgi:hypothetical protein
MPLGNSGGIPQRLHNIFLFKVGIIGEKLLVADSLANLTNDHADSYTHTTNTGLPPHNGRVLGYPVKILIKHKTNITQKQAKSKLKEKKPARPMPAQAGFLRRGLFVNFSRKGRGGAEARSVGAFGAVPLLFLSQRRRARGGKLNNN